MSRPSTAAEPVGARWLPQGDRESASPARARASAHARAAPPAPKRSAFLPAGSKPASRRRNRSNPGASVLCPEIAFAPTTIVFTARSRAASVGQLLDDVGDLGLVRHRDVGADEAERPQTGEASATAPGGTGIGM